MKRQEAIAIYEEIMKLTKCMGSNAYNLKLSKKDDQTSVGYQIRITTSVVNEIMEQIKEIAKKHNLAVKEEKDEIIVYKPKKT
jgi:dihydroxyacetone kinase